MTVAASCPDVLVKHHAGKCFDRPVALIYAMSSMQVKYCFLLVLFTGCLLTCGPGCSDDNRDYHYKQLAKVYSPDRTKYFTITEYGTDTASAVTQVLLNFKHTGSEVYSTTGIDKGIKAIGRVMLF